MPTSEPGCLTPCGSLDRVSLWCQVRSRSQGGTAEPAVPGGQTPPRSETTPPKRQCQPRAGARGKGKEWEAPSADCITPQLLNPPPAGAESVPISDSKHSAPPPS